MQKIVEQVWDYTKHAKFYEYRPNYADKSIDMLLSLAKNEPNERLRVADIGAGTGNLSVMLLERGCEVVSVEPNDAMRELGIERTKGANIKWVRATGLETKLEDASFDYVTFGSSFNVMDRNKALEEAHRLLKKGRYFSCMWNHRDLNDAIQKTAQSCILKLVPHYETGVRREDQRPVIEKRRDLFDLIVYLEEDFYFHQSRQNYILAWQSVKNPYWDLETKEGQALFEKIVALWEKELPEEFDIKYTTRAWSAKKV